MLSRFLIVIFFVFLTTYPFALFSQKVEFDLHIAKRLKVSFQPIRKTYHLNDALPFRFTVTSLFPNNELRFRDFSNSFIQFQFSVRKANNQVPSQTIIRDAYEYNRDEGNFSLIRDQRSNLVTLYFQESFSGRVDLAHFFEFLEPGTYYVSGFFYPLGSLGKTDPEEKNYRVAVEPFQFQLREPLFNSLSSFAFREENASTPSSATPSETPSLRETTLDFSTPQKTIARHIQGLKDKNWNEYLATLDLNKLLTTTYNNTIFAQRFQSAFLEEKRYIIEDFKSFLIGNITYDVDEYLVLETLINRNDNASVKVYYSLRDSFENLAVIENRVTSQEEELWIKEVEKQFVQKYVYTYQLENIDQEWKITAIETQIVKGLVEEVDEEEPVLRDVDEFDQQELLGNILFDVASFEVDQQGRDFLDNVILYLKENPSAEIRLEGHTDSTGNLDYNEELSQRRSLSVYNYFLENGIGETRISYGFSGDADPVDTNATEEGKKNNRRVEIFIIQ